MFNMISTDYNDPAGLAQAYPSPTRVYIPSLYSYERAEEDMHAAYDGETPLIAVECWDHPFADGVEGAWIVGSRVEVLALLDEEGLTDWEIQCELSPPEQ